MANVKIKKDIKNVQDLQNLVTGVIFRMNSPFTAEKVIELVDCYSKGADVPDRKKAITRMVDDTLELCCRKDIVRCWGGKYYPEDVTSGFFSTEYSKAVLRAC